MRKGGAQVVTQLVAVCNHFGITAVGPVSPGTMSAEKAQADTLSQIGVHFAAVGKKLKDAKFSAQSNTWQQATALYTVVQRLSLMDPSLALAIQPLQSFFQIARTKGKKRQTADNQKVKKVEKLKDTTLSIATPPAESGNTGSSNGESTNGAATPAPAVVTPEAPNGATHS
jgi:hypothetical protein